MFYFLAFCFIITYFALAVVAAGFIISRFFKNKKTAFLNICQNGLAGSFIGLLLHFILSFANSNADWMWIAITATVAGIIIGSIKAYKLTEDETAV